MQLSPSGHIAMTAAVMQEMSEEERSFWDRFLPNATAVIEAEKAKGSPFPYEIPGGLLDDFRTAVTVYDGDQYCQISQLRGIFDCTPLG
jgi:hypothetical protein